MQTRRGWACVVTLTALAGTALTAAMLSSPASRCQGFGPAPELLIAAIPAPADSPRQRASDSGPATIITPASAALAHPAHPAHPAGPALAAKLRTLEPSVQKMIERRIERDMKATGTARLTACFDPSTPREVMEAFKLAESITNPFDDRFNIGPRWTSTAYTPAGSPLGKPVIISWSIVPDGTFVEGFNGEPDSPSDLRAFLDNIYGSEAVWLPLVQSVFDRWEQVSGIDYVYEPSDDGADMRNPEDPFNPGTFLPNPHFGVPGVRGDVRIAGHPMNGPGGVLAYNFYPSFIDGNGGDMVIDTADTFYVTTNNSVRLRNVLSHEHGHGMGQPHVCPIETTKLMEPFASAVFDGPRHDDIRHAHYSYGDLYEPNDQIAEATPIVVPDCGTVVVGTLPAPAGPTAGALHQLHNTSTVSLSDENDSDYYAVTVSQATRLSVTMRPLGLEYDDASQSCPGNSGSCCFGDPINSRSTIDPVIELFDTDGSTSLSLASAAPAGAAETLEFVLPAAGTYYILVSNSLATATAQFYDLTLTTRPATISAEVMDGEDAVIPAGTLVPVLLNINDGSESFDLAASRFYYSINAGPTLEAPIYDHGGGTYAAALADIPCNSTVSWSAELRTTNNSLVTLPCSGVNTVRTGSITDIYSTDFTTNAGGWTVGPNTANAGIWELVAPIGTIAQPGSDHSDTDDRCFVTGQGFVGNSAGAADVDNGSTLLNSPTFSLVGQSDAQISYWRWYSNGTGAAPYADTFVVQVSNNNGSTWTTAEVVGPGDVNSLDVNGGWRYKAFNLSSLGVAPTAAMRVRFNAQDTGAGSIVEAAIDDFAVAGFACTPLVWCVGDVTLDGVVDDTDFVQFAGAYNELDCASPAMLAGCPSDLNDDGFVDDTDFVLFAAAYNTLICP